MVFESLVVDVLNRFLGSYVENLDASQLNLGIWGGDVVLKNLDVKSSALDDLDLPVKLKYGYLGELKLQIPWKNLYTEPVIATIQSLHILAVPNKGVQYDETKEKKNIGDVKAKELAALETAREARRKAASGKEEEQADSFAEKMVTQVIKNLNVTVKDIHIRYEDEYTNRDCPFAAGATLASLTLQTTDENWVATVLKDAVKLFHKAVDLDSVSVYWNSADRLISHMTEKEQIRAALKAGVASKGQPLSTCNYVLYPMVIAGRLKLNQKPETDGSNWSTPKVDLDVEIKELGLNIGKYQYQNILEFLESQERFTLSGRYRKYRPNLNKYKGHYKEWWKFAQTAILEMEVRRKARNWSWAHIKAHRDLGKAYTKAWVDVLTNKSPSAACKETVKKAEEAMDVFNLNVLRQQAEMEVDRKGLVRVVDQQGWVAWAKSWWSSDKQAEGDAKKPQKKGIADQFNEAMTPEEKAKLFEAIDYQENQPPTPYPKEFVDNKVKFVLRKLGISVRDESREVGSHKTDVVKLELDTVAVDFNTRSAAKAILLDLAMNKFGIWGMKVGKAASPVMVQMATNTPPLLRLLVETNPKDGSCDQSVKLRAQPLNVIFHAPTVNKLADVFKPPESVRLKALSAAAMAKYENVKAQSTTGLAHAVENRSRLCLDIAFQPSLFIVPETGVYTKTSSLLLLDLGALCIKTIPDASTFNFRGNRHEPKDPRLKAVMEQAYDNFSIELRSMQILFSRAKDDWMGARREAGSPLHLVHPTGFEFLLRKSSVDDVNVSKLQILGNLPDFELDISEGRLLDLLKLALSIPTPPPGPPPPPELEPTPTGPSVRMQAKMKAIMEVEEDALNETAAESPSSEDGPGNHSQVSLELLLVLKKIAIKVLRGGKEGAKAEALVGFRVDRLSAEMWMRPMDLRADASIGNLELQHYEFNSMRDPKAPLYIVENPMRESLDKPLMSVKYIQADSKHPNFATEFKQTEKMVKARFEALSINLHQEALRSLQEFGLSLSKEMADIQAAKAEEEGKSTVPATEHLKEAGARLSRAASRISLTASEVGSKFDCQEMADIQAAKAEEEGKSTVPATEHLKEAGARLSRAASRISLTASEVGSKFDCQEMADIQAAKAEEEGKSTVPATEHLKEAGARLSRAASRISLTASEVGSKFDCQEMADIQAAKAEEEGKSTVQPRSI